MLTAPSLVVMTNSLQVGMDADLLAGENQDVSNGGAASTRRFEHLKRQVEPPFTCRIFLRRAGSTETGLDRMIATN